jgi:hypothetical protein
MMALVRAGMGWRLRACAGCRVAWDSHGWVSLCGDVGDMHIHACEAATGTVERRSAPHALGQPPMVQPACPQAVLQEAESCVRSRRCGLGLLFSLSMCRCVDVVWCSGDGGTPIIRWRAPSGLCEIHLCATPHCAALCECTLFGGTTLALVSPLASSVHASRTLITVHAKRNQSRTNNQYQHACTRAH